MYLSIQAFTEDSTFKTGAANKPVVSRCLVNAVASPSQRMGLRVIQFTNSRTLLGISGLFSPSISAVYAITHWVELLKRSPSHHRLEVCGLPCWTTQAKDLGRYKTFWIWTRSNESPFSRRLSTSRTKVLRTYFVSCQNCPKITACTLWASGPQTLFSAPLRLSDEST